MVNLQQPFKTDSKRDATDSIRGYVYQMYQSIWAWIHLNPDELLVLEGAEDFDVHDGSTVVTTQVKDVSKNLTLRSQEIIDAMNNYYRHHLNNPEHKILFHFLTTADIGQEQGAPFGANIKGLEHWSHISLSDVDGIEMLRNFLLGLNIDEGLLHFIKNSTPNELFTEFIRHISWNTGRREIEGLRDAIEDKLKVHGHQYNIGPDDSCRALDSLFQIVANLLSTEGDKYLRFSDYLSAFEEATSIRIPKGQAEELKNIEYIRRLNDHAATIKRNDYFFNTPAIHEPIPIVVGAISRSTLVSELSKRLETQQILFLNGSSGLGKTNLASLITRRIGGVWGWIALRNMSSDQVADMLQRTVYELSKHDFTSSLVVDDLDFGQIFRYEHEFLSLMFSAINANSHVIVTGPKRPPRSLLPKLWRDESVVVQVPYFNETEIGEMIRAHGLIEDERVTQWARAIMLATQGHPQLVHARIRNLSAKNWPPIQIQDITGPEDLDNERDDVRNRIVTDIPSENSRILAYRLSLISSTFSRETAIGLASAPTVLSLPGEAFDELVGPWIEREGEKRYRISPLLSGLGGKIFSEAEITNVHGAIAKSIMGNKILNQFEVSSAFQHAFIANHESYLANLATHIYTLEDNELRILYNTMRWFTVISLQKSDKNLSPTPFVELLLRIVQFKLLSVSPDFNNALAVVDKMELALAEIKPLDLKQSATWLANSIVLNQFNVLIPSRMVIRMLSQLLDASEKDSLLKTKLASMGESLDEIVSDTGLSAVELLFSYQAGRISGIDDLHELISALDALHPVKRTELLKVCDIDKEFAYLLINRGWWKEDKDRQIDVEKVLKVYEFILSKVRDWKAPELIKATMLALSIVQEDYNHKTDVALKILDEADQEFPNDTKVINQRAKVLFHARRDSEAVEIAVRLLTFKDLSEVDFVFCCRSAGISSARLGNWNEAARLFNLGVKKIGDAKYLTIMKVGLIADYAFALWKQQIYDKSLSLLADSLDQLALIPLSKEVDVCHLHATVRHCVAWIHHDALRISPNLMDEPYPGMCSNPEPNSRIKDHRILDLSAAWELLSMTEAELGTDLGIKERAQIASGARRPQLLEGYARAMAVESIFKKNDFDVLIPKVIGMMEAMEHSKTVERENGDAWGMEELPSLPDNYWSNNEHCNHLLQYVLKASVIYTVHNPGCPLPIQRWREDLRTAGALVDIIDQFLSVLDGAGPNQSLHQQAGAMLHLLRTRVPSPNELWRATFRFINVFVRDNKWIEEALEKFVLPHWINAIDNQRYAFSAPDISIPEIGRCCNDESLTGLAKLATILDVALLYLDINCSDEVKKTIRELRA